MRVEEAEEWCYWDGTGIDVVGGKWKVSGIELG